MRAALGRLRLRRLRSGRSPALWTAVGVALLAAATAVALVVGSVAIPLRDLAGALVDPGHPLRVLVFDVRLARVVAGAATGAALAVAGALPQTTVRNPLADPGLLGVNAGAGVAVVAALVLAPGLGGSLPWIAFAGALVAVLGVLGAAWGVGGAPSPLKILLAGVAVQGMLFAAIALLTYLFADRAPAFVGFTVGSLSGATWSATAQALPLVALGLAGALAAHRPLDLLLLDDGSAAAAGLDVGRARLAASVGAAVLAAAGVALAGMVGFVGLLVPNGVRLLVGPAHRRLLPLSALAGAALLVAADGAARTLAAPVELPVGALLALAGGPYFLFVLWRKLP